MFVFKLKFVHNESACKCQFRLKMTFRFESSFSEIMRLEQDKPNSVKLEFDSGKFEIFVIFFFIFTAARSLFKPSVVEQSFASHRDSIREATL